MPLSVIEPDLDIGRSISAETNSNGQLCWTCSTCDSECPVFRATERLRPQKSIRMANLGMLDALLRSPDAWYCLSCRNCMRACPNNIKPYELHRYIQEVSISRGAVSREMIAPYQKLFVEFQRVRWRVVAHCFKGRLESMPSQLWYKWLKTPLRQNPYYVGETILPAKSSTQVSPVHNDGRACFTCNECSSCCPVFGERDVFDPQRIIRMANLGLSDQLLKSPSIWLCLGCQRCSDYCSQLVRGHEIIHHHQEQAIAKGIVDPFFTNRLLEADRLIYPLFLDEIDALLGMYTT